MGDFLSDGERAARGWRLVARVAPDAPSPLRADIAGARLLVFHAGGGQGPGDPVPAAARVACVVREDCPACGASRASDGAWRVAAGNRVCCAACGEVEAVGGDSPEWPVMCVDEEVYVYIEDEDVN